MESQNHVRPAINYALQTIKGAGPIVFPVKHNTTPQTHIVSFSFARSFCETTDHLIAVYDHLRGRGVINPQKTDIYGDLAFRRGEFSLQFPV